MPPPPYNMVITHGSCTDGWCSAWIAFRAGCQNAKFIHAHYGQPPLNVAGKRVLITDFSYPRKILAEMARTADQITILDHHKSAQAELDPTKGDPLPWNCKVVFDLTKSGAMLTWEHFHPGEEPPLIVRMVQDRDLWAWKLPHSREINASIRTYPETFESWDALETSLESSPETFATEGIAILRYQQQVIDQHVSHAYETSIAGHKILMVNATVLFSEIAGELAKNRPFGACWFLRSDRRRVFSLRSDANGLDVSEIAKKFGGGGHPRAAGYEE